MFRPVYNFLKNTLSLHALLTLSHSYAICVLFKNQWLKGPWMSALVTGKLNNGHTGAWRANIVFIDTPSGIAETPNLP